MGRMRGAWRLAVLIGALAFSTVSPAPAPLHPAFPTDSEAQEQTLATMNALGWAMLDWLTDNASSWPLGRLNVSDYHLISHGELAARLVPMYIDQIPSNDGWGNRFEFYLPTEPRDLIEAQVILIRSPGRDDRFETDSYNPGSFSDQQYDHDLVWADGLFLRWPRRLCERKQQFYKNACHVPPPSR